MCKPVTGGGGVEAHEVCIKYIYFEPCHYLCIHHSSPFTSITHSHPFFLSAQYSFHTLWFMVFLSTSHFSHQILLLSSLISPPPFSPCVQTTSTYSALLDQLTLVTPVLLHTSFLTRFIRVTPYSFIVIERSKDLRE